MKTAIDLNNKCILITGAAGFIGAALTQRILREYRCCHIIGLDNINDYYDPNVKYISSKNLTHFDSSLVESLESTFYGCISLESIDLSTFTSPTLTNMSQTFFNCSSLKALDLNS